MFRPGSQPCSLSGGNRMFEVEPAILLLNADLYIAGGAAAGGERSSQPVHLLPRHRQTGPQPGLYHGQVTPNPTRAVLYRASIGSMVPAMPVDMILCAVSTVTRPGRPGSASTPPPPTSCLWAPAPPTRSRSGQPGPGGTAGRLKTGPRRPSSLPATGLTSAISSRYAGRRTLLWTVMAAGRTNIY